MQTYKLLEDDGVLLTQPHLIKHLGRTGATFLNQKSYDRTNYITINYEALNEINDIKNKTQLHTEVSSELKRKKPQNLYTKIKNKEINNKSKKLFSDSEEVYSKNLSALSDFKTEQVKQVDKLEIKKEGRVDRKENQPIKKTTAQDMLALWNKTFPNAKVLMNKQLAKQLIAAFNNKLQKDIKNWKNYLDRLESSVFIMSEKFLLTLDWALKFHTIDRIFKGDLGAKDIPVVVDQKTQEEQALEHIQSVNETNRCKDVRQIIMKGVGSTKYNAWFTKVDFVESEDDVQMKAQNKFVEDYITQHFGHFLKL